MRQAGEAPPPEAIPGRGRVAAGGEPAVGRAEENAPAERPRPDGRREPADGRSPRSNRLRSSQLQALAWRASKSI